MRKKPTVRILGGRIRHYRQLRGLSQAALAEGICTQATISLIEKRNKVPSMSILLQLVARLGITLADVVVEQADRHSRLLNDIERLVRHGDYPAAEAKLNQLTPERLREPDVARRFYYFQGIVELFAHEAPDEAIYYFGRVLNPGTNQSDLLSIMATLGFALAYARQGTFDRARVYLTAATALMASGAYLASEHTVVLTLDWHFAQVHNALGDYPNALKATQHGIALALKQESLFLLDKLYGLQALTLRALHEPTAAENYQIALALASLNQGGGAEALTAQWDAISA